MYTLVHVYLGTMYMYTLVHIYFSSCIDYIPWYMYVYLGSYIPWYMYTLVHVYLGTISLVYIGVNDTIALNSVNCTECTLYTVQYQFGVT